MLVRYDDQRELKSNANKAQENAKILILTTVNMDVYEMPIDDGFQNEYQFSIELCQNRQKYFLCFST
jgi:hypothetical protein